MAEVGYVNLPDTQTQHIKDYVAEIREYMTPTLNSFKKSTRKVTGGQRGYQMAFYPDDYGQNSYLTPESPGNSFSQPIPPSSLSMWVGLSYQAKVMNTQGAFLVDMTQEQSLINEAKLRELAIKNFMKYQNYYAIGARNGVVAVVSSVTGGVFTGTTAATTVPGYTKGAHRLVKGVTYDIIDESTFAVIGTITPTANGTNSATCPVTTTGSPNNSGAFVVEQGAWNLVPAGLGYLISNLDRDFQGVDTTDIIEFNSSAIDLNGAAITSATLNTLKTKVQIRKNQDAKDEPGAIGSLPQGLYNTLAIQGFGARQYQAAEGQATTSYGYPTKYVDGDTVWLMDADMDEDRVYLRCAGDYFMFEQRPFGPVEEDGLKRRQAPGSNNVGAWAYYNQVLWAYNLGFDGDVTGGNYSSAFIYRAAVTNSQVNAAS